MSTEVWRKEMDLMAEVNEAGDQLLTRMDGATEFTDIVDRATSHRGDQLRTTAFGDIAYLSEASSYADRFLQSVAFTVALWNRGLVAFRFDPEMDTPELSPLLAGLEDAGTPLDVERFVDALGRDAGEDFDGFLARFHLEEAQFGPLLHSGRLKPLLTAERKPLEGEVVDGGRSPEFELRYVKPELFEKLETHLGGEELREVEALGAGGAAAAAGVAVIIAGGVAVVGDSAGAIYGSVQYGKKG